VAYGIETMKLITAPEDITPQWLTNVLRSSGLLDHGTVTSLKTTGETTMLSDITRMQVHYSDDAPSCLPARLLLKASRLNPDLKLSVGSREIDFYSNIASHMPGAPVPRCFLAEYFDDDHYQILLEDLSETHASYSLSQIPPTETECRQIVRAIAKYQAFWWDHPELGKSIGVKPDARSIRGYCEWAQRIYPRFADFLGDRLSPGRRALYEEVLGGLERALSKRLANQTNLTLFHGDSHIGNYLFPYDGDTACIIDWQGWGVELGVLDLVSLMAMFWFPERRARLERPLLQLYHQRLLAEGMPPSYSWNDCWDDYRLEILKALFFPMSHWNMNLSPDIWWNHAERICSASVDLDCIELLR